VEHIGSKEAASPLRLITEPTTEQKSLLHQLGLSLSERLKSLSKCAAQPSKCPSGRSLLRPLQALATFKRRVGTLLLKPISESESHPNHRWWVLRNCAPYLALAQISMIRLLVRRLERPLSHKA
jgi:hypothetical protein